MKSLVKPIIIIGIVFIGIAVITVQFIPISGSRQNPAVAAEPAWDSAHTRELFFRACGDCHSNETVWPWYSNFAPASWLIIKDVREARSHLNVSEWGRQKNHADEAAEAFREGTMPLPYYLLMHSSAHLNASEKQELLKGLSATFGDEGGEFEGDDD